jgi:hypothetical protein
VRQRERERCTKGVVWTVGVESAPVGSRKVRGRGWEKDLEDLLAAGALARPVLGGPLAYERGHVLGFRLVAVAVAVAFVGFEGSR